jgi:hypothetical protein
MTINLPKPLQADLKQEQIEELEITRRAVTEMKSGVGRSAAEMLGDMQGIINDRRGR